MHRPDESGLRKIGRRTFTILAGASFAGLPIAARAQQRTAVPRVVHLSPFSVDDFRLQALRDGLRELGYAEGRNLAIEYIRYERPDQLPQAVAAALAARPDVIVAVPTPTALAIKQATTTIPIVFFGADPIATGLVKS